MSVALRLDIAVFIATLLGCTTVVALALPRFDNISSVVAESTSADKASEVQSPFAFEPSALIAANPFGSVAATDNLPAPTSSQTFDIKLLGVLASSDALRSWAVLSINGSSPVVYRTGESIADGSVLQAVFPAHVEIQHPDRVEEVFLVSDELVAGLQVTRRAAQTAPSAFGDSGLEALARMASTNPVYSQPAEEVDYSIDGIIARYREAVRINPTSMRMRLGVDKTEQGYVVKGVTAPIMLAAGFRPGDLITKINGELVSAVDNEVELYDRVVSSDTAQVELVRNGETIIKSFPIP